VFVDLLDVASARARVHVQHLDLAVEQLDQSGARPRIAHLVGLSEEPCSRRLGLALGVGRWAGTKRLYEVVPLPRYRIYARVDSHSE
jgi:hypothetical protein